MALATHFLYAKVDYAQFITINRELRWAKAAAENNCKANFVSELTEQWRA